MHIALLALILSDVVLLGWTAAAGLGLDPAVDSVRGNLMRHWTLGLGSTVLTCFIHCLVMFYLIGSGKDIREAVEDDPALLARWVPETKRLKKRTFPAATFAILLMIVAALAGGEVHSRVIRPDGPPFIRQVGGWWVHGAIVAVALLVNLWAFWAEIGAARTNRRMIRDINCELAEREA